MEFTHRTKDLRITAQKLRMVAEKVKHLPVEKALGILPHVDRKGADMVRKALKAAVSAAGDRDMVADTLFIQRIWCDDASPLKRSIRESRGQSRPIMKKNAHLSIVINDRLAVTSQE